MEIAPTIFTESLFKEIDRLANTAVFLYDYPKGVFFYASPFAQTLLGYSPSEFINKGVSFVISFLEPNSMAQIAQDLATMIQLTSLKDKSLIHHDIFECKMQHADGHWLWTQLDTYLISFNESGSPHYFIFALTDIDNKKKADQFLWNELSKRLDSDVIRDSLWAEFQRLRNPGISKAKLDNLFEITLRTNPIRNLTEREKEVVKLISQGKSSKEIADLLKISVFTAETHRKNILEKFKVKNTAELIKEAGKSYWLGN